MLNQFKVTTLSIISVAQDSSHQHLWWTHVWSRWWAVGRCGSPFPAGTASCLRVELCESWWSSVHLAGSRGWQPRSWLPPSRPARRGAPGPALACRQRLCSWWLVPVSSQLNVPAQQKQQSMHHCTEKQKWTDIYNQYITDFLFQKCFVLFY